MAAAAAAGGGGATAAAARQALEDIDAASACAICHYTYDTPLVLKSCGHSYCSTCIRPNLEFQERSGPPSCPSCRKPCDSRDLLPNQALREVLVKYAAARPLLLAAAEAAEAAEQQQQQQLARQAAEAAEGKPQQEQQQTRRRSTRKRSRPPQRQPHQGEDAAEGDAGAAADGAGPSRRRTRAAPPARAVQAARSTEECIKIDLAGDSSSGWSEGDASSASEDDAPSSVAASDLSSSPKRQRRPPSRGRQAPPRLPQQQQPAEPAAHAPAAAPADTPSGFVRCPVCSKSVPSFYINSHIDQCLAGGGEQAGAAAAAGGPSNSRAAAGGGGGGGARKQQPGGPFQPLALPAKLVPSLATEKSVRQLLRKYSMPTDGKKKELLERYSKLRLAVEMANDKQERTTYEQLAKRVTMQERQMAAVQLLQPAGVGKKAPSAATAAATRSGGGGAAAAAARLAAEAAAPASSSRSSEPQHPADILLVGYRYRELIAVTRQRDALRRTLRSQQTQEQPAEQQQQQAPSTEGGELEQQPAERQQQQQAEVPPPQWPNISETDVDDSSSDPWAEDHLPLSQNALPEWEERQQRRRQQRQPVQQALQHRLAVASVPSQEQLPPNSCGSGRVGACAASEQHGAARA